MAAPVSIHVVGEEDLEVLLPLVEAYLAHYGRPFDEAAQRELSQCLLEAPEVEGLQLLARDHRGRAVAFATLFWTWSTLRGARTGTMNDLYVVSHARGAGIAEALMAALLDRCAMRGAVALTWQTAEDNLVAQRLYERVGATRSQWVDFHLPVPQT